MNWMLIGLFILAALGPLSAALQYLTKLLWSSEYRALNDARIAAKDDVIRTKDAEIAALQDSLKGKDITIELYKAMSYADAQKQLIAQKQLFDQHKADYEQKIAGFEEQLVMLAGQLEAKAVELSQAQAESRGLRIMIEEGATLTRQAVGTLSDYRAAVAALNARADMQAVVVRGGLQVMEEANRVASRGRSDYPPTPHSSIPTIPPDTTAPASLDYETR